MNFIKVVCSLIEQWPLDLKRNTSVTKMLLSTCASVYVCVCVIHIMVIHLNQMLILSSCSPVDQTSTAHGEPHLNTTGTENELGKLVKKSFFSSFIASETL